MPTLGLTYQEAESLAEFLLTPPEGYVSDQTVDSIAENLPLLVRIWEIIEKNIPAVEFRYLPLMYITGILTGVIGWRIFLKRKS